MNASARPLPQTLPAEQREAWRCLPFEGANNFRELGGYRNVHGQQLRWGMLYRADKLSSLSDEDLAYFERLGICRVVDFRADEERVDAPNRLPENAAIDEVVMAIAAKGAAVLKVAGALSEADATPVQMGRLLVAVNRELVEDFSDTYSAWMRGLLEPSNYPQLFHCTAGKDRTGFAAAILLRALDVPMETVMADYLATNHYTAERIEEILDSLAEGGHLANINRDALRALFAVEAHYLGEAFAAIDEHYGSFSAYLEKGLGFSEIERQGLRELLLEDS